MSLSSVVLLATIITNLVLGTIVFLKARKESSTFFFYALIFCVFLWATPLFIYTFISTPALALWMSKIAYFAAGASALCVLNFAFSFNVQSKIPEFTKLTFFNAVALCFLIWGLVGNNLLKEFLFFSPTVRIITFGKLYPFFIALISGCFTVAFYVLYKKYKNAEQRLERSQLRYVFLGMLIAVIGAIVTNLILPSGGDFTLYWLGPIFTLAMVASITYAIFKHNLFDIKVIATEVFTVILWVALFVQTLLAKSLSMVLADAGLLLLLIFLGILLIRSVNLEVAQREQLQKLTGQLRIANTDLLLRNRYLAALQSLTNEITRTLDLRKVTQEIVDGLSSKLDFVGGFLILLAPDNHTLELTAITKSKLLQKAAGFLPQPLSSYKGDMQKDNTLVTLAMRTGRTQVGTDLSNFISPPIPKGLVAIIQTALRIRTVLAVPIISEDKTTGCLLVTSRNQKVDIAESEIQMIKALGDEVGIVTRNLKLYEQLEQANAKLVSANEELSRLDRAKTEFLSIASHQLRTPLTAIKGYMSMILAGDFGSISEKQLEPLKDVSESAERLISLVNDLLDVSRIASGRLELHMQAVDLVELTREVMEEILPKAEAKGIKLVINNKIEKLLVRADREKLRQVIINLVDNAIKYTDRGEVGIDFQKQGESGRFAVKDNGIGISREELPQLFQRFMRTREAQLVQTEGTGLGLYVAKTIIEAQAGKIWAESQGLGHGSSFVFELPQADPGILEEVVKIPPHEADR